MLSGPATSAPLLIGPMILVGLGNGIAVPALTGAVLAGVHTRQAGAGAGVLTTSQQFASAAGIPVLGSIFFQALGPRTDTAAYLSAFQWEVAFSLLLALGAATLSILLPRPGRDKAHSAPSSRAGPGTPG
jgi:MFS family permease